MKNGDFQPNRVAELRFLIDPFLRDSPYCLGLSTSWPESRWHWLKASQVWLKREDELGFPGTGPKQRKLLSLAPALVKHDRVISAGSSRSVFLLSLSALCRSLGLPLDLHLIRATPWLDQGVDGLYKSLLSTARLHWVDRSDYPALIDTLKLDPSYLPEGGCTPASLPGSLSLAVEILEQSQRLSQALDEIWIDAGSGFTAQALILGLGFLQWPGRVRVVLCAGDDASFQKGLADRITEANNLWPAVAFSPCAFDTMKPSTARSYGSTNRQIWKQLQDTLQKDGVLLDPIYNAKLHLCFHAQRKVDGRRTLLIHSGGALTTFAYPEAFLPFQNLN